MKRITMNQRNNFALLSENRYRDMLFNNTLYQQIINSLAFKRLQDIRFLGAIDYTFRPNKYKKRHTQYLNSNLEERIYVLQLVKFNIDGTYEK